MQVSGSKQLDIIILNYQGDCLTSDFYRSSQDWQHSALQRLHTETSLYEWSENKWTRISPLKDLNYSYNQQVQHAGHQSEVSLEQCIGK